MNNQFELLKDESFEEYQDRLGICLKDDGITTEELEDQDGEE